ncbi:MAG: hypothetical protein ACFCUT_06780 [Kiloniellaceae bacterium]
MQKLNRRAVMAAFSGVAAMLPGVALAAQQPHPSLEDDIRTLIAELRSDSPPEDLWKWKAGQHEADFLTFGQHETNKLIAARLERLLQAEG